MFNLKEKVVQVIAEWTADGDSFTAFDVTMKLRGDYQNEQIYHNDVKSLVHAMFLNGEFPANYTRTANYPVGNSTAILYHDVANPPNIQAALPAPTLVQQATQAVKGILNGLQFWKS